MPSPRRRRAPEAPWVRVYRRLRDFFLVDIWEGDPDELGWPLGPTYRVLRVLQLAVRGIFVNRATFTASALTFTTVLTLVPLLAFAFSVAKGIGAFQRLRRDAIEPFIANNLGGDTQQLPEAVSSLRTAIDNVLDLVSQTDVSSLGLVGLVIVVYAVIRVLSNVEDALNRVWGVRRARSPVRRVADYLSLAVITPLLMVLAVSMTTAAQNSRVVELLRGQPGGATLVESVFSIAPLLSVWIGFTLLYLILPNTRVSIFSSIIGGLVGGTLWQLAQIGHVRFQMGIANYNAIYSSFAALPIFLVWIYVSWVTVLFGGEFAHAHQIVGEHRRIVLYHPTSHRQREALALRAVLRIARRFTEKEPSWIVTELADELGVSATSLDEIFEPLIEAGLLAEATEDGQDAILLARDPHDTTAVDLLEALRGTAAQERDQGEGVLSLLRRLDEVQEQSSANPTLAELTRDRGSADPS